MSSFYFYLFAGILLIILEIATTTFYLLVIGVAFIIASLFALKFDDWTIVSIFAFVFAIIGTLLINIYKRKHNMNGKMLVNHLGQTVEVTEINGNSLRVLHSGSYWNAYLKSPISIKPNIGDKLVITKFSNSELEVDTI